MTDRKRVLLGALASIALLASLATLEAHAAPSPQVYVDQGIALYKKGDCLGAVQAFKQAISLNPRYARAYSWLALCYEKLGRVQEALGAFRKVVELAPGSEDARLAEQWIRRLEAQAARPSPSPAGGIMPGQPSPTPAAPTGVTPVTPPQPPPSPATGTPVQATPAPPRGGEGSRSLLVMPFAEGAAMHYDAGRRVAATIQEELFKAGKIDTISHQRLTQALGVGGYDPLDVGLARQTARRVGAGFILMGLVDRAQVISSQATLVIRLYTKEAIVSVSSFQLIDAGTGQRLLSDAAAGTYRVTAVASSGLRSDDEMLRVATQKLATEIVQRVLLFWGRRTGELTAQLTEAVVAGNITRDVDFRVRPTGTGNTFPASSLQVAAYVAGRGAKGGQKVEFVWYDPDGREFARGVFGMLLEQQPDQPFYAYHVIRPSPGGTLSVGRWRVEVLFEGYAMRALSFTITE